MVMGQSFSQFICFVSIANIDRVSDAAIISDMLWAKCDIGRSFDPVIAWNEKRPRTARPSHDLLTKIKASSFD
jgi:hypothetical protein